MTQPTNPPTREATPFFLIEWRRMCDNPPKCCHTCEHYGFDGHCAKFNTRPPREFVATQGVCDAWQYEAIPF